jgi:tetratricopeptide (TPR) repeat protein
MRGRCLAIVTLALMALPAAAAAAPARTQRGPDPTGAQAPAPLPRLAIETFPPASRDAISAAYRTAEARPSDAAAVGAVARLLHAWEQWDAAHEAYARCQALAPRVFDWHYLDGVVLQRLVRHREAAAGFKRALEVSPDYLPARIKLAEALFEAGDLDESARLFDALASDPATEPMGHFGLGRVAAARGNHEEAITRFQRALALSTQWGAAYYALALSYRAVGRRADAQQALEQHARHGPSWPALEDRVLSGISTLRDDASTNLQKGLRLASAGDLAGAIAAHEAAVARDPSYAQAHANLITLYGRIQDWDRAEAHYRAVVALGAGLGDAHYDFGVLLGLQGQWDRAAEAYRAAIAVNPQHANAHNNLGQILERQGQVSAAAGEYRLAVASRPDFRLARFNLGRMLIALGEVRQSIGEFEKLTEPRDAEAPRYLFALATAHARAGDKALAIKWATDARELAVQHGQGELAAAIERQLAAIR